jgi:anti-sigma-K factor RskA
MRQPLSQVLPVSGARRFSSAGIGGIAAPTAGVSAMAWRFPASYGEAIMGVSVWRQGSPRAPLRERVASWRARNWRRAILAWFVLTLAIMAVAAEPAADFPKAQLNSVPAVRVVLQTGAVITAAGVPVLLAALP